MVEASAIVGLAGYVIEGFCILGAGVMIGFLRALVAEKKGCRRRKLGHTDADGVGEER